MESKNGSWSTALQRDLAAGLVVSLVALPLCLGVALASNAPLLSGLLAGVVGGIVVGALGGTRTGVSGPAAGLSAVVAAQVVGLGSFSSFLAALVVAGMIQVVLGIARAGSVAAFFPSSVVKGLLTAIGLLLILKQLPHVLGHDPDPEGEMAFLQPDRSNTFTEIVQTLGDIQPGAALVGLMSLAMMVLWGGWKPLKRLPIPAPLAVVLAGTGVSLLLGRFGGSWAIGPSHRVEVPIANGLGGYLRALERPDFSQWSNPAIYAAALTIAAVASLESLLNLEAIDKIDPRRRTSSRSRELMAQGVGNVVSGLVGGLPITLVIARSSVNIHAGARTRTATIFHGVLLLTSVVFLPAWLNLIPLSCLAAILLITGVRLARPSMVRKMWSQGYHQFVPYAVTVAAIVFTDLLVGILIGLAVSLGSILRSNVRRPMRRIVEKHLGGEVLHIELSNQVSFLNRAALARSLDDVPKGGHVLLDALGTDYVDPDVLDLIRDFKEQTGPARGIEVSLVGFQERYQLQDQTQYVDYSTREIQASMSPDQVLRILKDGHDRFRLGHRLTRDLGRQVQATASGQHPLAVILSCMDSRAPAELIFDLGVGDVFVVRVAGNVASPEVLGSIEYGCAVAGAKLIVIMGHTRCGAVTGAVNLLHSSKSVADATGCQHLDPIVKEIQESVDAAASADLERMTGAEKEALVDAAATRNVTRAVGLMLERSWTLEKLAREGRVAVVGAMYDVASGNIAFLDRGPDDGANHSRHSQLAGNLRESSLANPDPRDPRT